MATSTDSKTTAITTAPSRRKWLIPTITVGTHGFQVKPKTPFDSHESSFYVQQLAALDEDYEQVRAQAEFDEDHSEETKHYGNPAYVRSRIHTAVNSLVPPLCSRRTPFCSPFVAPFCSPFVAPLLLPLCCSPFAPPLLPPFAPPSPHPPFAPPARRAVADAHARFCVLFCAVFGE